ncbi:MAG: helix-turn-helix domain-containing protein [Planctomycetes bacterium]|nr:helix-turn-helix domain-containing protein [Planctomycetota bacterium]
MKINNKMTEAEFEMLSVSEVCSFLKVSKSHCYWLINNGFLPALAVGPTGKRKKFLIPKGEFLGILDKYRVGNNQPFQITPGSARKGVKTEGSIPTPPLTTQKNRNE